MFEILFRNTLLSGFVHLSAKNKGFSSYQYLAQGLKLFLENDEKYYVIRFPDCITFQSTWKVLW